MKKFQIKEYEPVEVRTVLVSADSEEEAWEKFGRGDVDRGDIIQIEHVDRSIEEVDHNHHLLDETEFVEGTVLNWVDLKLVPFGTKFHVINGAFNGEVRHEGIWIEGRGLVRWEEKEEMVYRIELGWR